MTVATVVTLGYGSFGSIAFVVGLGYGDYGTTPPSPPPPPPPIIVVQGPAGGPAFPRRPEYKSTLEFYKSELRKQEKQAELQQLEELSQFYQQRLAEPEQVEQPSFVLIQSGIDALVDSIEQYRTEKSGAAQIAQQIAELVQRIDEESLILLLS